MAGNSSGGASGNRAGNLIIFGMPAVTGITLSGNSSFVGAIYAPEAVLTLNGGGNAKFQVSLKFRLFKENTTTPFLEKLYLAYSQTSLWAIGKSSAPFYDSSYPPRFFSLDAELSQWPFRTF